MAASRWRAAATGCLVVLLAGCGGSDAVRATGAEDTTTTTVSDAACPHVPAPEQPPVDEGVGAAQSALQDDVPVADRYGRAHPDDFGGIAFDRGRLQVAFAAHVDEHRAALRQLLGHPDQVDVVGTRHTVRELDAISTAVQGLMGGSHGQIRSAGTGFGYVAIELAAGREDLAERWARRWGDAVQIAVGDRRYVPTGCGDAPRPAPCPALDVEDPATAGLAITVELDEATISRYDQTEGHVTVRNVGDAPFRMDTGQPLLAVLVEPGTAKIVARYTGAVGGTGWDVSLAPGEQKDVPILVGTTACGIDATVPEPGRYGVRVVVGSEEPDDHRAYLSPEAAITLSATPPPEVAGP